MILFEKESNNLERGTSLAALETILANVLKTKSNENTNALLKIKIDELTEAQNSTMRIV
jgi:hypothetical protein